MISHQDSGESLPQCGEHQPLYMWRRETVFTCTELKFKSFGQQVMRYNYLLRSYTCSFQNYKPYIPRSSVIMSNGWSDISSGIDNCTDAANVVMGGDCRERGESWN